MTTKKTKKKRIDFRPFSANNVNHHVQAMKIRPVRTAPAPSPIPTAAQAAMDPSLVSPAPAARHHRGAGPLFGAGIVGSLFAIASARAGSASGQTPDAPAALLPGTAEDAEAAARAEAARAAVATTVAPILKKAIDEEGRGSFGCVAVDPPTILSENEALDLIEQEFARAGVKLRDCYELSGYRRTRTDWDALKRRGEDLWRFIEGCGDPERPRKTEPGSWIFDFATEDGSVLLEYLSRADHDKLKDAPPGYMSTVSSFDFPDLAERFRADLETRARGEPVTIGLFFDPMAGGSFWDKETSQRRPRPGSSLAALSEEERRVLDWRKREELLWGDALELLREQVRFFIDWARMEGKLPAQGVVVDQAGE